MGDRIVVMSNAVVQQIGTPQEVYGDPANLFVARFIGSPGMNLIAGRYDGGAIMLPGQNRYAVPAAWRAALDRGHAGKDVILGFRPEAVRVAAAGALAARVYADDLHGAYTMLHLALGGDETDETIVHARAGRETNYPIDTPLRFDLDEEQVRFFDPETEKAISKQ